MSKDSFKHYTHMLYTIKVKIVRGRDWFFTPGLNTLFSLVTNVYCVYKKFWIRSFQTANKIPPCLRFFPSNRVWEVQTLNKTLKKISDWTLNYTRAQINFILKPLSNERDIFRYINRHDKTIMVFENIYFQTFSLSEKDSIIS